MGGPKRKVLTHPQETKGAAKVPWFRDHLAPSQAMLDHSVLALRLQAPLGESMPGRRLCTL